MTDITRRGFLKRVGAVAVTTAIGPTVLNVFIPMGQPANAAAMLPINGNLPAGTPSGVVVDAQSPYAGVQRNGLNAVAVVAFVPILQVRGCVNMALSSDYRYRAGYQPAIEAMGNNGPSDGSMIARSAANHRNVLAAMTRV